MKRLTIMMLAMLVLLLTGCFSGPRNNLVEGAGLKKVQSDTELKTLLKTTNRGFFEGFFGTVRTDDVAAMPEMDGGEKISSDDYTKTNVQVEGVDEGDIVKTDGSRIYSISYNALKVVDLYENGRMEVALYETLKSDDNTENYYNYTYFTDLYVTSDYLIVIGQRYAYTIMYRTYVEGDEDGEIKEDFWGYHMRYTSMSVAFIYDKATLEKVETIEVSGNLLTSRLIDDRLYFISNHYVYSWYLNDENYDPRPWILIDGEATYVEYEDIQYLPDMIYQSFTIISTILLKDEIVAKQEVFLGAASWGQIYVSLNAIYFGTTYYERNVFGSYKQRGKLMSFLFDEKTHFVTYGGTGEYSGNILNQFSMDEYNGYMRIATTEGWGDDVKNRLYVFERVIKDRMYVLEVVGSIEEGLGKPRETIQSVRFQKDKATVVTFEQIDPFYTIDLSNPRNPRISGELEVTGFSTYQHPWMDDYVIGIGYEVVDGAIIGIKLSVYDITDFDNPVEIGKPLILGSEDNTWAYSEALFNHKAILSDPSRGFIGFSLHRYNWSNMYFSSTNDYLVFEVDLTKEEPISVVYTINHLEYFDSTDDIYTYYWYFNFNIERAVRVDDYLYVISGEVITSHHLNGENNTADVIQFAKINR